ncbi:MAG TPA: serine hydrolase domain-containing protein [Solirubrobacteraceae bacterium]|nr:serine hydrolase domain-containing protein [Solirubrobacteraceae bacterium]
MQVQASAIDGLLQGAVDGGAVPGVVAVVGDRDGTVYEQGFGRLSVDGEAPAQPDSMMAIMSMTKPIASVAALQLIEQGSLELEQPVADVLPAFAELQVLEGFDGETPRLRAPARQASMRHLLTHTSGLGYAFVNADLLRYYQLTGIDPNVMSRQMLDGVPLIADPGTRWEYGTSTDWLGRVIEAISGQSLAAYCERHIFAPLGMPDATFTPSDAQRARGMALHTRTADGGLAPLPLQAPDEPDFFSGGSGAYATAGDYLRFMRAVLRGGELDGERILAPETVELAFSDQLAGAPLPTILRSQVPELSHDVPALPFRQAWGLGFHLLLEDIPGMRRAGSGDWAGLFNSFFWIDRASGLTGALFTQLVPFFDPQVIQTLLGFESAAYAGRGGG